MSYICVDIEWDIPKNPEAPQEALSIGAVYAQDDAPLRKPFFKYIQPEHKEFVLPDTLKLLHIGPVPLMQASNCVEVMQKFDQTFPIYDTLVIWNRDALSFLKQTMESCGTTIHTRRIVVLQDLLQETCKDERKGSTMGFKRALKKFEIAHNPDLFHISKFDALYLQQLYCAISNYLRTTAEDTIPLFRNLNSHTLHHEGCRYLKNRTILAASWEEAIAGEPLCRSCAGEGALRVFHGPKKPKKLVLQPSVELHRDKKDIPKKKKNTAPIKWAVDQFAEPFDEAEVEAYCAKREIGCTVACHWIFIRTPVAHWRIEHDGHKVLAVFHENLYPSKHSVKKSKLQTGFYQQKVYSKDVFEVISYIKSHDQKFLHAKEPSAFAVNA